MTWKDENIVISIPVSIRKQQCFIYFVSVFKILVERERESSDHFISEVLLKLCLPSLSPQTVLSRALGCSWIPREIDGWVTMVLVARSSVI